MKKKGILKEFLTGLEETLLIGSTLVEGSTLTEQQAKQVLRGRTVAGHAVQEHRELLNYRNAIEWLVRKLKQSFYLSEDLIFGFHERLFGGFKTPSGSYKKYKNFCYTATGEKHWYTDPSLVPSKMKAWIEDFNMSPQSSKDPAPRLAQLYNDFEQIHPFEDGNGRMGRIFAAIYAFYHYEKKFIFHARDRLEHLKAMEKSNGGDLKFLDHFIKMRLK